jgi:maleylpyruvate isomerase
MNDRLSQVPDLLDGVTSSTETFVGWVLGLGLSDDDARAPSELPGWSRGHTLSHIARNADGIARTLRGGLRGEIVPRYPGGSEARNQDINAGAVRPAAAIVADVVDSAAALAEVFAEVARGDGWALKTAEDRIAAEWLYRRWREVEIHRVDVGSGYLPAAWPASFVETLLPDVAADMVAKISRPARLTVAANGSVSTRLVGRRFDIRTESSTGAAADVSGPDWALACWLIGRNDHARSALGELPEDLHWR